MVPLEQTLDQWHHWCPQPAERPRAVAPLSNGLANCCWRVETNERSYAVRISTPLTTQLKLNWEQELRATRAGDHAGVGPAVLFSDPGLRTMVLDWAGECADISQLASEAGLGDLARLIKRLHSANPALYEPGYVRTMDRYIQLAPGAPDINPAMLSFAEYLDRETQPQAFCHHDLTPGNILVQSGQFALVDWEYARLGHPLFDLGSLVESLQLDENATRFLFEQYGAPESYYSELADMRLFIQQFTRLWEQAWSGIQADVKGS